MTRNRCNAITACFRVAVVLVVAHLALLVGVTTPEKFYFDEVHY